MFFTDSIRTFTDQGAGLTDARNRMIYYSPIFVLDPADH